MTLHGIDYLRHRPPFLFVDTFELTDKGAKALLPQALRDHFAQRSPASAFWFDVECAAQLFGCFCRASISEAGRPGYLSSYRKVTVESHAAPVTLQVKEVEFTPTLRRFDAIWCDANNQVVMTGEGAIAMPEGTTLGAPAQGSAEAAMAQGGFAPQSFQPMGDHTAASARWAYDPEDEIFMGHFPDDPIVPGILLGEKLTELALWAQPGAQITEIENMVFAAPVLPGQVIELSVKQRGDELSAMVLNGKKRAVRMKMTLRQASVVPAA